MKIQCDVCEKKEASVFCAADEAALCEGCDYSIHRVNKLAIKHLRCSLLHPSFQEAPLCDICQERRAFLFCKEDRAILCRECDIPIHKANEHTQNHNRFLLTGVKISSSSITYPTSSVNRASNSKSQSHTTNSSYPTSSVNWASNSNSQSQSQSQSQSHTTNSSVTGSSYDRDMFNQYTATPTSTATKKTNYNQFNEEGSVSASNTISEYLMETLPGWRLEDLFDSASDSHTLYL